MLVVRNQRGLVLLGAALLAVAVDAKCAADNCYRALFPCPSPSAVSAASSFCATITAGGVTATNYPARATSACGHTPDRYISACKCGPTCSGFTTPTATSTSAACTAVPTTGIPNGDFECGLAPWTVQVPDPAASFAVQSPGNTGTKALQINFNAPAVSPEQGVSIRAISKAVPVTPGTTYLISYSTWFDNSAAGFIGLQVNWNPRKTVDAGDFGWNVWHENQYAWQANATETSVTLIFDFVFGTTTSVDRLDTVKLAALASCDDAPYPGILPNGGFDCGIGSWTVQVPDSAAKAGVKSANQYSGTNCFQVDYAPPSSGAESGVSARIISKSLPVTPGKTYELSFFAAFTPGSSGFIGVWINNPLRTIDANDGGVPNGYYREWKVQWTAPAGVTTAVIEFEFLFGGASVNRLDSIVFKAL